MLLETLKPGREIFMEKANLFRLILAIFAVSFTLTEKALSFDSDLSRQSLKGLAGFHVVVEDLNANVTKYAKAQKFSLAKDQIKSAVERKLQSSGIKILSWQEMLKTPGKPIFYVVVNTHEYEKFWFAYDVKTEVHQMTNLENNPSLRMNAVTWSLNMTGVVNIGTMSKLQDNVNVLVDRFVNAYQSVNR